MNLSMLNVWIVLTLMVEHTNSLRTIVVMVLIGKVNLGPLELLNVLTKVQDLSIVLNVLIKKLPIVHPQKSNVSNVITSLTGFILLTILTGG